MKYEKEIEEALSMLGMSDNERREMELLGYLDKEELSRNLETGVQNGYTVRHQLDILKVVLQDLG